MQKIKHYTIQIQIIKIFNTNENDTIQLKTLYNKKKFTKQMEKNQTLQRFSCHMDNI